jgi:hypothetical protein
VRRSIARHSLLVASLVLLVACSPGVGSIPGVFTTGDIRILDLDPDVRACVVTGGTWLAVLGENLGSAAAWASGENTVTFPPRPPGILADDVQLVGNALFMLVPAGIASGTMIIDAGAQGVAEVPITAEGSVPAGLRPQMVGTICTSNPPTGS